MLQVKLCLENRNGALFDFSISSIVTCLLAEQSWSLARPNSNLEFRNLRTRERRIHKANYTPCLCLLDHVLTDKG